MRPRSPAEDTRGPDREQPGPGPGGAVLQESANGRTRWLRCTAPVAILATDRVSEIGGLLREAEREVAGGRLAAGFIAYDAAPGLDRSLVTRRSESLPETPLEVAARLPLAWFGLYDRAEEIAEPPPASAPALTWQSDLSPEEYRDGVRRIREWIAAAHTYQVNFTRRLRAPFSGDPWELFRALHHAQRGSFSAYIDTGRFAVCSASPELFFRRDRARIVLRPMTGTRRRGGTLDEDEARATALVLSEKDRAENLMIVDMVRNDLGRVAATGSVRVARLFEIERYETVWQMTSTVEAETGVSFPDLFRGLFPCASVTGAPKVRTMELIAELEREPRGVYCGAIGFLAADRAQFNVAIRTVSVDRAHGVAEYGTGGGIVWDSDPEEEDDECRAKAAILTASRPVFRLLETMRLRRSGRYVLLDRHLRRMEGSARYFGFVFDRAEVRSRLEAEARAILGGAADFVRGGTKETSFRVRLLVDRGGKVEVEWSELGPGSFARALRTSPEAAPPRAPWRVELAAEPVDPADCFLYHKTTHRAVYERARVPGQDDVLLWNRAGELTEATVANLVVRLDGAWFTPPVCCGLLAGTYRDHLLERGVLRERVIRREDLARCERMALVNSVRGWIAVRFDSGQRPAGARRSQTAR